MSLIEYGIIPEYDARNTMTNNTDEINLPPLPIPGRSLIAQGFEPDDERLRAWGRAAVEADRQSRMPIDRLNGMADMAYSQYIQQMRAPECLGWEQKVKTGKFGEAELKAHTRAGEFLGRHRAFSECVEILSRYSSDQHAAQYECGTCQDSGMVGHSDICPECRGGWQPAASAEPWKECRHCGWECRPNMSKTGWRPLAAPVAQEPIHLLHLAVADENGLRWMSGRRKPDGMDSIELYAMPDGGRAPAVVYAAPVAAQPAASAEPVAWIFEERYGHGDDAWIERIKRDLPPWEIRRVQPLYDAPTPPAVEQGDHKEQP